MQPVKQIFFFVLNIKSAFCLFNSLCSFKCMAVGSQEEGEEGAEPSTSGEGDFSANPMSAPSPPPGLSSGDNALSSHSRKRKQSSPQPRRDGTEVATAALPSVSRNPLPPTKKIQRRRWCTVSKIPSFQVFSQRGFRVSFGYRIAEFGHLNRVLQIYIYKHLPNWPGQVQVRSGQAFWKKK